MANDNCWFLLSCLPMGALLFVNYCMETEEVKVIEGHCLKGRLSGNKSIFFLIFFLCVCGLHNVAYRKLTVWVPAEMQLSSHRHKNRAMEYVCTSVKRLKVGINCQLKKANSCVKVKWTRSDMP